MLFDTYDVTDHLQSGANAIGIWLGNGYDAEYSKWGWRYAGPRCAIAQLQVELADGTQTCVVSDGSWQTAPGPIIRCGIYWGESYDARQEQQDWSTPRLDHQSWSNVVEVDGPQGKLVPGNMPPIRVVETRRPKKVTQPRPGLFVFDMGQNFAGWVRLRVRGEAGTKVVLRHSELLGDDGMIDPWTNRAARATDTYWLKGEGEETYEPRFTYHGFRYVEVSGYPGTPTLDDVTGCVVHADVTVAGTWKCSDPLLNRIQQNFLWGMRSNLMSIPTDCPMRDERTPCAMDSHAFEDAAMHNFHMDAFYTKWLRDIQGQPNLPDWPGDGADPDWSGERVLLPWRLWQHYGDRHVLAENYASMKAYVDLVHAATPQHICEKRFGDWCAPNPGKTWENFFHDVKVVNTALYYRITTIVADTAEVLGHSEDAEHYRTLAREIRQAFNQQLMNADRRSYGDGSQTTSVLPLALGIVPESARGAVFDQLADRIVKLDQSHLDTGIIGSRFLFDVLCDGGRSDLAVAMLRQKTYPGYGFQIEQGATTTWEQWSAKGPMNSHNHAMFAGPGVTFYTRLAGIRSVEPGYKSFAVHSVFPSELDHVSSTLDTPYGWIAATWTRDANSGVMGLQVSVPVNTSARSMCLSRRWMPLPRAVSQCHPSVARSCRAVRGSGLSKSARAITHSVGLPPLGNLADSAKSRRERHAPSPKRHERDPSVNRSIA